MDKYFMHRIKEEDGAFTTGIEVHDTKEAAVRSFHGYMKQGYGNSQFPKLTFVYCFVEGPDGKIDPVYRAMWQKPGLDVVNKIFHHHIRLDNGVFSKAIDVYSSQDEAEHCFHAEMEYGYGNPNNANVSFQDCKVTERLSPVVLMDETWVKPEEQAPETAE